MLEEIDFVIGHTDGHTLETFIADEVLRRAVLRSLEILGEATKNLSEGLRAAHPEVEWSRIAGLRDVLIHQYFGVSWRIVWNIIQTKLPVLQEQLEAILREQEDT
jgi:uncharacterized protein with HEPN domain